MTAPTVLAASLALLPLALPASAAVHLGAPPAPRLEAARTLRRALGLSASLDAGARGEALAAAASEAARRLPEGPLVSRLAAAASGSLDPALLEPTLARALSDLEFERRDEAELPRGFPEPAPVGEIRLARYPSYRMARTPSDRGAFWRLFRHIQRNEIAMTAPVEMRYEEAGDRLRESEMAFLYGAPELGPLGERDRVEIVDAPGGLFVTVGCRGRSNEAAIAAARGELEAWLARRPSLAVRGDLRVLGYNSPMVPARERYFEVQLPVRIRIFDFSAPDALSSWTARNDGVMGGVSLGRLVRGEGCAVFEGLLSPERGGGFASVRAAIEPGALDGARRIVVRARGDGRTYELRLFTEGVEPGVSYAASFETAGGEWTEHALPLEAFRAVRRGRPVPGAPALRAEDVRGVGLLLAGGQFGEFRLELASLDAE